LVVTGVDRRAEPGTDDTTAGLSAVAAVASCTRIASLSPTPSLAAVTIRRARCAHLGQVMSSGTAVIECTCSTSSHACEHRKT